MLPIGAIAPAKDYEPRRADREQVYARDRGRPLVVVVAVTAHVEQRVDGSSAAEPAAYREERQRILEDPSLSESGRAQAREVARESLFNEQERLRIAAIDEADAAATATDTAPH